MLATTSFDQTTPRCLHNAGLLPQPSCAEEDRRFEALVHERRRLGKGEKLFAVGDAMQEIYVVRTGTLKALVVTEDGHNQVLGFYLPGELIGLDGLAGLCHTADAVALEDSEVCVLRLADMQALAMEMPALQLRFLRAMGRELSQEQTMLVRLGSMRAEERLAAFLVDLSRRMEARGYSPSEFNMRMTREDIGSYLGLTLETVSRLFSRLAEAGLIAIRQRNVKLLDLAAIRRVYAPDCH
ncbi:helix-turn-helix domain-containing protein [Bordetella genomosp. 1]|uniref:Transcriptional regulator n=1 Tax=Bordetella genomosp. 1 TaxID=1395607 RepID=A0ABX4F099_9BORD|nr:helix-turn-helix domain-containing protein [Bordetella genomosp. 1]MDQ8032230.1 helix-turn-helix domain-containing protein [Bordetella sp.]OZI65094.1 transcriptional regulator [Bordetella genomosp. 1]